MSNFGQAALTIGGTFIGAFFGYPQLGFMLGSLAGNVLFPTQLPTQHGPKLEDLAVQGSSVGVPVAIVYGSFRVAGNIIWSTDLIATTTSEDVGGKGGPQQTIETTTYAVNFAVGLCEGEITGIRRVWAGGKLIYDRRPQLPGEATSQYTARLSAANAADSLSALYLGTEDQLPDPTIEAWEGMGNVPAYRGLAYIVFHDFQLADYGNNLMGTALSFEVIKGGAIDFQEITSYAPRYVVAHNSNLDDPFNFRNDHNITATLPRAYPFGDGPGTPANNYVRAFPYNTQIGAIDNIKLSTQTDILGHLIKPQWAEYHIFTTFCSKNDQTSSASYYTSVFDTSNNVTEGAYRVTVYYSPYSQDQMWQGTGGPIYKQEDIPGATLADKLNYLRVINGVTEGEIVYIESLLDQDYDYSYGGMVIASQGFIAMWSNSTFTPYEVWEWHAIYGSGTAATVFDGGKTWITTGLIAVSGIRAPRFPDPPCHPRIPQTQPPIDDPYPGFCFVDSIYQEDVAWAENNPTDISESRLLKSYGGMVDYPEQVEPLLHVSDTDFLNQTFWEARYAEAEAAGTMPSGLVYDASGTGDYPTTPTDSRYYTLVNLQSFLSSENMTLAYIVADLCRRSGLATTQYDVTDLIETIDGYGIGRVMDAASAIQPLRLYGFFDMVESNGVLKFVLRGGAEAATLEENDLAAHEAGGERPAAVEIRRMQDVELPRVMRVKYLMLDKDYEPGEQVASRLRTTANQIADVEIAVAMTDTHAAQIADILLYEAWQGRNTYTFSLSQKHLALEPTDPVLLPVDGGLQRVRILSEDFSIPGIKKIEAVRDGGFTAYSSYVGEGLPLVSSQTLRLRDNTIAFYLDLPMLLDSDSSAGYYIAMRQEHNLYLWPGGAVLRSADLGASYVIVATATRQSVTGFITDIIWLGATNPSLPFGDDTTIDYSSSLVVSLDLEVMTLSSTTEAGLLTGANAVAIGAHGRWEIIQFLNATLTPASDGNTWELTGLTRRRRGTDYAGVQTVIGDRFIVLRNVVRAPQEIAAIGAARLVKAITNGQPTDAQAPVSFTGNGEALRLLSPVHLTGQLDVGTDDYTISWIRRSRFGQELPSGADIPLGEETEKYDLEIWDGIPYDSGSSIVRTVTVTSPTYVYSAANQTSDLGGLVGRNYLYVTVFQISSVVGRGHVAIENYVIDLL